MRTSESTRETPAAPAVAAGFSAEEVAMETYIREGEARAYALGNRGPIRLDDNGRLHPDIVASYWRHGFYVFEDVVRQDELDEIEVDQKDMMDRLPTGQDTPLDHKGHTAITADL